MVQGSTACKPTIRMLLWKLWKVWEFVLSPCIYSVSTGLVALVVKTKHVRRHLDQERPDHLKGLKK